jgi:alpha-maltose-1-phosphate synthase
MNTHYGTRQVDHPRQRTAPLRVLFLNENIGGHAALHAYLREALSETPALQSRAVDRHVTVPPRGILRRVVGSRVPGFAKLDLDFQPLRAQLATSEVTRRRFRRLASSADVVHLYTQNAGLLSGNILEAHPSVVSTDATNQQNGYQLPYRQPTRFTHFTVDASKRFEQRVFDAATLLVAHSQWAAASMRHDYGVPEERIRVIPFGVPVSDQAPRRPVFDRPQITFIGTTMDRKGGWVLLDLFKRRLRGRATLNLVTRDHVPAEHDVRVFNDFVTGDPRLAALLATTSVFAFPSEIDKWGFAVLEAMAAGVAPVVFRTGGVAELVEDGVSGLVVDDVESMAVVLSELVDDPQMAEDLGKAARMRALERFDARITTGQLLDVLEDAVWLHAAQGPIRPR